MNRTKYILRVVFLLLTASLLVYLNRKTDDNVRTIAEFKFEMLKKMQTDSIETKHKLDLLQNETTKFIENSSHVRKGIRYLMLLIGLIAVIEMGFLILEKRNPREQGIK